MIFNVSPDASSSFFSLILNSGPTTERVFYDLNSQAGLIYDSEAGSKTISIDINTTMTSPDLPAFDDFKAGLVLEMED